MGTEKRARQKANRQAKLAEVEAETEKEQREESTKKWGRIIAVVGGLVAIVVLWNVLTGGNDEPTVQFEPSDSSAEPTTPPEIVLANSVPDDFVPWSGSGALARVVPEARNAAYSEPPPMTIDPANTYIAVIDTDAGDVSIELYADQAPITVNNFVNLARDGFYDGVTFHRVLEGFMAQGGDPTGSGTGGPGYTFEDEVETGLAFDKAGLLAMANAGPATNGSQFFITFDPATNLNGRHTIFGEVVRNEDVLPEIVRHDPRDGDPDGALTVIESIRIIES